VDAIAALEAIGWRVTELRPSIGDDRARRSRREDPDVALEELARHAASDAGRE
jgi:hypothetical protein